MMTITMEYGVLLIIGLLVIDIIATLLGCYYSARILKLKQQRGW